MLKQIERRLERLERRGPWGPWMAFEDYLRGHPDDFLGDQIADQYEQQLNGVGSAIALLDGRHGGWVELVAGPGAGRFAKLWLGSAAGNHDSLDPDEGFLIIVHGNVNELANVLDRIMTVETGANDAIMAQLDTAASPNWRLLTGAGGAWSATNSTVIVDSNPHWHALEVSSGLVNWYLDGTLIVSKTTDIPTVVMTASIMCYSYNAVAKSLLIDYWAVIPRDLSYP